MGFQTRELIFDSNFSNYDALGAMTETARRIGRENRYKALSPTVSLSGDQAIVKTRVSDHGTEQDKIDNADSEELFERLMYLCRLKNGGLLSMWVVDR